MTFHSCSGQAQPQHCCQEASPLFIKYYKLGHTNLEQEKREGSGITLPGVLQVFAPTPDSQWEVTDGLRLALPTSVKLSHSLTYSPRPGPLDQLLGLEGPWVGGKGRSGQGMGHPDAPGEGSRVRSNVVIYWSVMVCGCWLWR